MPYLRVRVASPDHNVTNQEVAKMLTQLDVTKLGKAASVAAVDCHFTDPKDWFIGGKSLVELGKTSFFVEIKITEATNTRDQKAAFVKAAFAEMVRLFPNIADTSYVVIQDVASEAWGFGGKTQEFRYIQSQKISAKNSNHLVYHGQGGCCFYVADTLPQLFDQPLNFSLSIIRQWQIQ